MAPKDPVDPRWKKERVGRISWRLDEMKEDWEVRKAEYEAARAEKQAKADRHKKTGRPPYEQRSAATLDLLQETFGVGEFAIRECYGSPYPHYPGLGFLELRALQRDPGPVDDGMNGTRMDMLAWVEKSIHLKSSEALCDLDCGVCPRAMALNCAAQNTSAAAKDHVVVAIHNPLDHYAQ